MENSGRSVFAEGSAHAVISDMPGELASAVQNLDRSTACPDNTTSSICRPDDMMAGMQDAKAAARGSLQLSARAVLDPSQASERSAVHLFDESETPRSGVTAAPAAEDAAPFPVEVPAGGEQGIRSSDSLQQLPPSHHEAAMTEAQEAAVQLPSDAASALDLARNARSVASKAAAAPLSVDHPLVKQAALELSRRAAIEKATLQVANFDGTPASGLSPGSPL